MTLYLTAPLWFNRSCDDCEKWLYNDDGTRQERGRYPLRMAVPRARGSVTPCHKCPKIPLDAPEKTRRFAQEMTPKNWQAYKHYRECAATGQFPADAIVRRNAAVIKEVLDGLERFQFERLAAILGVRTITRTE